MASRLLGDIYKNVVRQLAVVNIRRDRMKAADLHKLWGAPDNSRLTAKQQSFRLPIHVAAKIDALCDLFPTRSKTEIVGDLLVSALEEAVQHLPVQAGEPKGEDPEHGRHYAEAGLRAEFRRLANKHYRELEREAGNKDAGDLYKGEYGVLESELGDRK